MAQCLWAVFTTREWHLGTTHKITNGGWDSRIAQRSKHCMNILSILFIVVIIIIIPLASCSFLCIFYDVFCEECVSCNVAETS